MSHSPFQIPAAEPAPRPAPPATSPAVSFPAQPVTARFRSVATKTLLAMGVTAGALGGYALVRHTDVPQVVREEWARATQQNAAPMNAELRAALLAARQGQPVAKSTGAPTAAPAPASFGDEGVVGYGNRRRPGYDEREAVAHGTPIPQPSSALERGGVIPSATAPASAPPPPAPYIDDPELARERVREAARAEFEEAALERARRRDSILEKDQMDRDARSAAREAARRQQQNPLEKADRVLDTVNETVWTAERVQNTAERIKRVGRRIGGR